MGGGVSVVAAWVPFEHTPVAAASFHLSRDHHLIHLAEEARFEDPKILLRTS